MNQDLLVKMLVQKVTPLPYVTLEHKISHKGIFF